MDRELTCANCGIVIRWQPTMVDGKIYCCLGCAEGGPCKCDYDNLPEAGRITPIVWLRLRGPEPSQDRLS
jgi:hypothetical protein